MLNNALLHPQSIAIIGASHNLEKPGGRLVENLRTSKYKGRVYLVNPKEERISGQIVYSNLRELPQTDLAILAIPASACVEAVEVLAASKGTKVFIIISAGFSEGDKTGKDLEQQIKDIASFYSLSILGPNCIGMINDNFPATFVSPPPKVVPGGVDFVSASGAFAVFLFEAAANQGLNFGNIYSVGNSVVNGVEEILTYWNETYQEGISSKIKLIYVEQIKNPCVFFHQSVELVLKGCHLLVLKPGESEAGARAAQSHTGALAGDNKAFDLLIRKTGAYRCYSREEMVNLACILQHKPLCGQNIAVITDAGGPGVMLADQLSKSGFVLPAFNSAIQTKILDKLFPGATANNPIDMLATCTRDQLAFVISVCDSLEDIDGIVLIYGKTGMEDLNLTYSTLSKCILNCSKPVYTIAPSVNTARKEIEGFIAIGNTVFSDEVIFAQVLGRKITSQKVRNVNILIPDKHEVIKPKALNETQVFDYLKEVGIPVLNSLPVQNEKELDTLNTLKYPLVAKVMGIIHKTEVQGVILNLNNKEELLDAFRKLLSIEGSRGVIVQEMIKGTELFIGGKMHPGVGYSLHIGLGGILVELMHDISSALLPVSREEALEMILELKSKKLFQGYRNSPPIDIDKFIKIILQFSELFRIHPEIYEMDINPLVVTDNDFRVVDARILVLS